jgi:hypothetical protein
MGRCALNSSSSEQGPVAGCCERGNEPSGSIDGAEIHDYLSDIFSRGALLHGVSYQYYTKSE